MYNSNLNKNCAKKMTPFTFNCPDISPLQAMLAVHDMPYSLWLDSADTNHPGARYSFILCHPLETIESKDGVTTLTSIQGQLRKEQDPFAILQERLQSFSPGNKHLMRKVPPFQGGAAGYFGYDLGRNLERLPEKAHNDPTVPDMAVGIYDMVFAYDHDLERSQIIVQALHKEEARQKHAHMLRLLSRKPVLTQNSFVPQWRAAYSEAEYKNRVQKIIDYIHAGDIFQANFTQRFDAALPRDFDAFVHYLHMRISNPAPFATFMNLGNIQISSASPERFLKTSGARAETRPIKGTRPRSSDKDIDILNRNALLNSEKDTAENTMIVDLMRNDFSRICTPESINVRELCVMESFASLHHLVSTVEGRLPNDKDSLDLLRACFPGGSITGAPKIRAMEIIEELEDTRRGPYCGAAGYIGFDGNMDTNILIRTLIYNGASVSLQTGGGIVADSRPAAEYQEMLDKAEAIFKSFERPGRIAHRNAA